MESGGSEKKQNSLSPEVKYTLLVGNRPVAGLETRVGVHGVGPSVGPLGVWGGRGAQRSEDEAQARLDRDAPGSHWFDMLFVGGGVLNVLPFYRF